MSAAGACLGLLGCWLAAGIDARQIEATLWLARCAQADVPGKLISVYSLSHAQAFPCSFLLMVLMTVWHLTRSRNTSSRRHAVATTSVMWLGMFPVCLLSEHIALGVPGPAGVQTYAFLMLATSSAMMQLFNHKNFFPERGCR